MSRAELILTNDDTRQRAVKWVMTAKHGTRLTFKEQKRSIEQNALFWARLTDIARQLPWHGVRLAADDWRLLFLDSLKREMRIAPNLDGTGFVNLGRSSSDLSKAEFADLLTLMEAFAAQHGVKFSDLAPAELQHASAAA